MMGWDWHAKRLARVLRDGDPSVEEPRREMIEAILHLGEMAHVDLASFAPIKHFNCRCVEPKEPTPRFKSGDGVITLSDEAVPDMHDITKGAIGSVECYTQDGQRVIVNFGVLWYGGPSWICTCREDQLKLVPAEPKQTFWEGDCARCIRPGMWALTKGHLYVVLRWTVKHGTTVVYVYNDKGKEDWYGDHRFTLAAPGPNHPAEK